MAHNAVQQNLSTAKQFIMGLLTETDPAPFHVIGEDRPSSTLLVCDHASNAVPAALDGLGLTADISEQHVAWDIGAAAVARGLAETLHTPLVLAGYSRLVIDLNRDPTDPASIPEVSDDIPIPGNRGLSDADKSCRVQEIYNPYHGKVADLLSQRDKEGWPPALFSIHSFTPLMKGETRPWDIGVLWNKDPRISVPLMAALEAHPDGLTVGNNEPYSGAQYAHTLDIQAGNLGIANCAVEIRQDLVSSEDGVRYWIDVLTEVLPAILNDPRIHTVQYY